ncbi:MAG: hypothetical protein WD382_04140 [Halofilum sp. (in: g-proteobacteria)]
MYGVAAPASRVAACSLALGMMASVPAHAVEYGWLVGGGLEYSDNIDREADDQKDGEWIRDVRAGLTLREETSRFEADFDGLVQLEDYADNAFSGGVLFEGTGSVEAQLVPGDRVTWMAADSFQQVPEITRSVDTRANEQNANAFVTGPDVELPLGAGTLARASARWGDYYFEETDEDHTRNVLQIGAARRISSVSEVGLYGRTEDVTFDDEEVDTEADDPIYREDFETNSAFGRYERAFANQGRVTIDLGGYEVEREQLDDFDGVLAQLDARRGLGARSELGFRVSQGPTDIGSGLASSADDPLEADTRGASITGDVGEEQAGRAFYSHRFGRFSFTLSGGLSEEQYREDDELDREAAYAGIDLDYVVNPRRTVFADFGRSRSEYAVQVDLDDSDRDYNDYDDYWVTVGFDQRLGRALTLTGAVEQNRRDAHGGGIDYTENRARVTLVYGFGHPDVVGDSALFDEDV